MAARNNGRWPHAAQLLVRVHPRDAIERYAKFEGLAGVIIEKPFKQTVRSGDGMAVDMTADAQRHLANTMRHSDVVVQVASTIAIEAAIFDTPVVNVSFDGPERRAVRAVGAALHAVHALGEHRRQRRDPRRGDAGADGRARRPLSRSIQSSIATAAARWCSISANSSMATPPNASPDSSRMRSRP